MSKHASTLLAWYDKYGRNLPWRKTKNAYRIFISEMMLQQTQVDRVKAFYKKWLVEFPTWKALAKANNAQVIKAWAGLGYNRRAIAMRDIAKHVIEYGEPKSANEWQALKGIGSYTSAAISLFSGHDRQLPIDTNVRRVMGRLFLKQYFARSDQDEQILRIGTKHFMTHQRADDAVQALFDLAAAHCKKAPVCETCPMRPFCKSASDFLHDRVSIPKQSIQTAKERIHRNKKYPDRIYRGRILKVIREAPRTLAIEKIGPKIDASFDPDQDTQWLQEIFNRLERDQMVTRKNGKYQLNQNT